MSHENTHCKRHTGSYENLWSCTASCRSTTLEWRVWLILAVDFPSGAPLFEGTTSLSASHNTCIDGLSSAFGHTLASKDHFKT